LVFLAADLLTTKASAFAKATADRLRHEEKLDADFADSFDYFDEAQYKCAQDEVTRILFLPQRTQRFFVQLSVLDKQVS